MLKQLIWLSISIIVILADRFSKILALEHLTLHQPLALMPGFNFTLAFNTGSAFSFLASAGPWHHYFFILLTLAIALILLVWLMRSSKEKMLSFSLSLLIGGALGNLWDRLQYGHVVDFIDLYFKNYHFATFNIADVAITLATIGLLYQYILKREMEN